VVVLVKTKFYDGYKTPNPSENTMITATTPQVKLDYWVFPALPISPAETDKSYTLRVSHVNAYWDPVYLPAGFTRGNRTATTSYNCHGHSTGKNHWMDFSLIDFDYESKTTAKYMRPGAIYGSGDHTGKVDVTIGVDVNNAGIVYRGIVKISEKFAASAVYERTIFTPVCYPPSEVIPVVGSPFFGDGAVDITISDSSFYVPKS